MFYDPINDVVAIAPDDGDKVIISTTDGDVEEVNNNPSIPINNSNINNNTNSNNNNIHHNLYKQQNSKRMDRQKHISKRKNTKQPTKYRN